MSPSIWTRCEGRSRLRRLSGRAWRVVEYQYLVSTRKLVASDEEQRLLEDLIEQSKPAAPAGGLHFLLSTPFRYPPLRHGSRFRRRTDPGVWYGSQEQRTPPAGSGSIGPPRPGRGAAWPRGHAWSSPGRTSSCAKPCASSAGSSRSRERCRTPVFRGALRALEPWRGIVQTRGRSEAHGYHR